MLDLLEQALNTQTVTMVLAAIAAAATVLTLAMPFVFADPLDKRMQRGRDRAREDPPARTRAPGRWTNRRSRCVSRRSNTCRRSSTASISANGSARKKLALKLVQAGYPRSRALRHLPVLPHGDADRDLPVRARSICSWCSSSISRPTVKLGICIGAAYLGMHLPLMFLKNRIQRRQLSIKRAFPDTLDLLLICVESGMSIEAAFQQGQRGSRLAVGRAGRRTHAHHGRTVLSAGPPSGLRESRQAHRSRWRQIGLHGVAASRALRHAARSPCCA